MGGADRTGKIPAKNTNIPAEVKKKCKEYCRSKKNNVSNNEDRTMFSQKKTERTGLLSERSAER